MRFDLENEFMREKYTRSLVFMNSKRSSSLNSLRIEVKGCNSCSQS